MATVRTFVPVHSSTQVISWGLAALCASLLTLTVTMFALPPGYNALWWGINPLAPGHWADHLHLRRPDLLSPDHWGMAFRLALVTLWISYAFVVLRARCLGAPTIKQTLILTATTAAGLAVFAPPLLATDSYAYAAYARLAVLYGQNPYTVPPYTFLKTAHDPTQYFLSWNIPTVYGPVWTGLSMFLVRLLPSNWLWGEVIGMKLIEAGALCLAAWSAGRIAERLQPGHGRWATLAVGLNPLLLLEGPMTGHNDLLMMALTLTGAAAFLEGRQARAGLWLGLAVGVKLLPLALLPWLLIEIGRTRTNNDDRLRALCVFSGLALLPSVLGYTLFWHGLETFSALHSRVQSGHSTLLWAALAYIGLTLFLWKQNAPGLWLTAWAVFSAALMLTGMGFAFPWYIIWFWPVLLAQPGRLASAFSCTAYAFSLIWVSLYSTLYPLRGLAGH